MAASPLAFLRGAALVMAADLATTPTSGITVQLCGDAHLLKFGVYGSPERQLVFDLNAFDETLSGPWEWDVMRLAVSVLVGRGPSPRRTTVAKRARETTVALRQRNPGSSARRR